MKNDYEHRVGRNFKGSSNSLSENTYPGVHPDRGTKKSQKSRSD